MSGDIEDYTERLVSRSPIIVRRRILWGDCDPACVVYTPRLGDYVVAAREWFFRVALGLDDHPVRGLGGTGYPARALSFDFVSFLEAGDWLEMMVRVGRVGDTSFTIDVTGSIAGEETGGRRVFQASLTSICFDLTSRVALPLPDDIRAALDRYALAQPAT